MQVEFRKKYEVWIPGEPVAKSTQRPPRGPNAFWIVQNNPKYKRLKATWEYQRHVSLCAAAQGFVHFQPDDPIKLSVSIRKSGHKTGDTKNIIAAVEDGLQWVDKRTEIGGFIPNDRQVTSYGDIQQTFMVGKESAGVRVYLQIDPLVLDIDWLSGWLKSRRKAEAYQQTLFHNLAEASGMDIKGCISTEMVAMGYETMLLALGDCCDKKLVNADDFFFLLVLMEQFAQRLLIAPRRGMAPKYIAEAISLANQYIDSNSDSVPAGGAEESLGER